MLLAVADTMVGGAEAKAGAPKPKDPNTNATANKLFIIFFITFSFPSSLYALEGANNH
jgi:hypothetical protein